MERPIVWTLLYCKLSMEPCGNRQSSDGTINPRIALLGLSLKLDDTRDALSRVLFLRHRKPELGQVGKDQHTCSGQLAPSGH